MDISSASRGRRRRPPDGFHRKPRSAAGSFIDSEASQKRSKLGVDNTTLLDGIEPVGNTFVSLTGYQAQGYANIPIY
jgi:hypothetical protein